MPAVSLIRRPILFRAAISEKLKPPSILGLKSLLSSERKICVVCYVVRRVNTCFYALHAVSVCKQGRVYSSVQPLHSRNSVFIPIARTKALLCVRFG
jgi:hypothetical protein